MNWQDVEKQVRRIAESVWTVPASPEREAGVKCDIVLKSRPDYWVVVEVSKENNLAKLRIDLAKLQLVRQSLMSRQIYCECHFVTSGEHTSLKESGSALNVEVHDVGSFASKFLGTSFYLHERRKAPFGSAVNPDTGAVDLTTYTPIAYIDDAGQKFTIEQICAELKKGRKIALLGEFGTGKSRCLMQAFQALISEETVFVPIAINLRENWGYKRFSHIVQNHLDSLGLGKFKDVLVRSLREGNHILLLDGFDEIGSQSWSGDPARLTEIRRKSLEGVRDLVVTSHKSGFLITGREHYFSTNAEMADCLGLELNDLFFLRCPDEFTDEETATYLRQNTKLDMVPEWMPRKPLICQLLARLEPSEVLQLQNDANGEVNFFESVFDAICQRETKIHPSISRDVLKGILLNLAQYTRQKSDQDEKLSTTEINQSFYDVSGYSPIDESAVLLQRLPYLGRVGSGGSERIFIDNYAKDGLRGLALASAFSAQNKTIAKTRWLQPIGDFGVRVLATKIVPDSQAEKYARFCISHGNSQVACDFVTLKLFDSQDGCDFNNLRVADGRITKLNFGDCTVKSLHLSNMEIDEMTVESTEFHEVTVEGCVIAMVKGVGSAEKLPSVFENCLFGKFDDAVNISRISELGLPNNKKTLLAIIKKLFFQPGAGRQEEALLRGAEAYWDRDAAQKVMQYMETNKMIFRLKGNQGPVLIPRRKFTKRMANIWELRSSCRDELWERI